MVEPVESAGSPWDRAATEVARVLIVGLGNPMMADDGIGHAVVGRLRRSKAPPGVRIVGLAGDVLGLGDLWWGEPKVWLVDALDSGSAPGSIRVVEHQDLLALSPEGLSIHHLNLSECLRWLLHAKPEMATIGFTLYSIEIGALRPELGLSSAVDEAGNRLIGELVAAASA